jgi:hypothetical protein
VVATLRDSTGYRSLRAAMAKLSPSQRGQWLAVAAEAALRDDPGTLTTAVRHWRDAGNDRRRPQRKAADQVAGIGRFLEAELPKHGVDASDPRLLTTATLVMLDDVIDDLRRGGKPDQGDGR